RGAAREILVRVLVVHEFVPRLAAVAGADQRGGPERPAVGAGELQPRERWTARTRTPEREPAVRGEHRASVPDHAAVERVAELDLAPVGTLTRAGSDVRAERPRATSVARATEESAVLAADVARDPAVQRVREPDAVEDGIGRKLDRLPPARCTPRAPAGE